MQATDRSSALGRAGAAHGPVAAGAQDTPPGTVAAPCAAFPEQRAVRWVFTEGSATYGPIRMTFLS